MKTDIQSLNEEIETLREDCLRPTRRWGRSTQIWLGFLLVIVAWGLFAYYHQIRGGLGVTAMRN